jgi:tRNA pseudouridine55 synthase
MTSQDISGILNINKPGGITSHDVVHRVRKILGTKKVGHTGTLDPMAVGVLLVCVGQATRLIEYLVTSEKQYQARLKFGQSTSTYDADGEITETHDPSPLTEAMLRHALTGFVGNIQQQPPAFSAIKKNGVPFYKLARKGVPVTPPTRTVRVETIDLLDFAPPEAVLRISCQAGVYVRSIAHDVGQVLGVGAHLTELIRLANGSWRVENAISLDALEQAVSAGNLEQVLQPKELAVSHLPKKLLSMEELHRVSMGQFIDDESLLDKPAIAAYNQMGQLAAILIPHKSGLLKPKKVFLPKN